MSNRVLAMAKPYSVEAIQATEAFTIKTSKGLETVVPGNWLVCRDGFYHVYTDHKFQTDFEIVVDLKQSFNINANDVEPIPNAVDPFKKSTEPPVRATLKLVDGDDDGEDFEVVGKDGSQDEA